MTTKNYFYLDGKTIPFKPGQTIMDAALAAGESIPHLCHHPEFTPHGSCRICIVRSNGRTFSACTQPASQEMEVENNTPAINQQRRALLQMLFVEGNHICPGCEKSGDCQLQAIAYELEMLTPRFTHFFPHREVDASHPDLILDFNRCILCELCVRASRDMDNKNIFEISGRGMKAHLTINSASGKLGDSQINSSDRAARICPVGALLPKGEAYKKPIGQRRYDQTPISQSGNQSKDQPRIEEDENG